MILLRSLILNIFLFTLITVNGQNTPPDTIHTAIGDTADTTVIEFPEIVNNAFKVGEHLIFDIRYGFVVAGKATMSVKEVLEYNGKEVYHIQTTAESSPTFSWFYKVEDEVNSFIDSEGLFSWKFDKKLREGTYYQDTMVEYNPYKPSASVHIIRYNKNMKIKKEKKYEVKTPPFVHDILAAFYYVRNLDLAVGTSQYLTNHDNKKVYNLEIKTYKNEKLKTEAGTFNCLVVEPLLQGEGIFKQKGRLKIWMTDDQYKIPVKMTSEVIVGHITTELTEIKGLEFEIPAQVK